MRAALSARSVAPIVVLSMTLAGACARGGASGPAASPTPATPPAPAASGCAADELGPLDGKMLYRDCHGAEDACRAACERDDVEACFGLAIVVQEREIAGGGTDDATREAESSELYRKACLLGAPNACTNHAAHLWRFSESRADLACAVRLFEATCEVDDHFGCGMAGRILLDHADGPDDEDVSRARALLERSCAQLGGFPCRILALNLERGRLGPVPDGRIRELMQRACDGRDDRACGDFTNVEGTFGP